MPQAAPLLIIVLEQGVEPCRDPVRGQVLQAPLARARPQRARAPGLWHCAGHGLIVVRVPGEHARRVLGSSNGMLLVRAWLVAVAGVPPRHAQRRE